jgi:hypothetical protein
VTWIRSAVLYHVNAELAELAVAAVADLPEFRCHEQLLPHRWSKECYREASSRTKSRRFGRGSR